MIPNDIRELLKPVVSDNIVEAWYISPNEAFEGKTPEQMFAEDRRKEVFDYLFEQLNK